jgi:uncharacterized protein (DUF433 family)
MVTAKLSKPNNGTPLGFYTPTEASRIARVPEWTVNSWRRQGIVVPSVEWVDEQEKVHVGHTFETLVFLRLIRMLREKQVTLLNAVEAMKLLRERFGTPSTNWADIKIVVDRGSVYVNKQDDWETTSLTQYHQKLAELLFGEEFKSLKDRADALLIPNQYLKYVEIDTSIQNGLPIIIGTSILTSLIHKLVQKDIECAEIQKMYPFIPKEKIVGVEEYEIFLDKASMN